MARAPRGDMHALFFGMKRAFHASLRVMRRPLFERFGLTAARFDMLWCIHQSEVDDDAYPVFQSDVRKKLGVTAATVTRMMKSLEALGLVQRERDYSDRRQMVVSLTRKGIHRIQAAYAHFVEREAAERVIRSVLRRERTSDDQRFDGSPFDEQTSDEERALGERQQTASCAMGRLGELLDRIRKGFGDRAELDYLPLQGDPGAWLVPGRGPATGYGR